MLSCYKFRAKSLEGEHNWVYGYLVVADAKDEFGYCLPNQSFIMSGELFWGTIFDDWAKPSKQIKGKEIYKVKAETIGMYSGFRDKKGNEVYHGDIIERGDKRRGVVFYAEGCFQVKWCADSDIWLLKSVKENFDFEVIGNIYDNPELVWCKEVIQVCFGKNIEKLVLNECWKDKS